MRGGAHPPAAREWPRLAARLGLRGLVALVWAWLGIWGLGTAPAAAAEPLATVPGLEQTEGRWILRQLPAILDDSEVGRHLDTGLTTGFDFRAELPGGRVLPCAHIEIRYEPWDEIYFLKVVDRGGVHPTQQLPDRQALVAAWAALRLDLGEKLEDPLRLVLDVLPFSQGEQRDTQRWFSETLARAGRGNAEGAAAASKSRSEALGQALHVLMATSIERRAISTFRWTLALVKKERS